MWPNIHIIYVHIYIYVYITHLNCKIILGGFFSAFAIFWRMRSGDVMMIRKSAEIASKSSDVQNISGYCQYREAGCKTGSFTIFYTNRFQPEKMFRKYLAKEQGKLRKTLIMRCILVLFRFDVTHRGLHCSWAVHQFRFQVLRLPISSSSLSLGKRGAALSFQTTLIFVMSYLLLMTYCDVTRKVCLSTSH